MDFMPWVWLAAIVAFAAAEAATNALVSLWFVGGSLAALIAALCKGPLWLQAGLFVVVSAALLFSLRPLVRKYAVPRTQPTNASANIGKRVVVTEDIDALRGSGAVKLSGVVWAACTEDGATVPAGTVVEIVGLEGARFRVKPVADGEPRRGCE